jgi:hypothetical protein
MTRKPRIYTEAEAIILGTREVCRREGHKLKMPFYEPNNTWVGGTLGQNAPVDQIECRRGCGVKFTATYPPIGQEATP